MEFKINDLTKTYNNKIALDQFTYTFGKGVYGILGPNGAGKSTLLKLASGLYEANAGHVILDNIEEGKESVSIESLINDANNIGKVFNLDRVLINEYLDQ